MIIYALWKMFNYRDYGSFYLNVERGKKKSSNTIKTKSSTDHSRIVVLFVFVVVIN